MTYNLTPEQVALFSGHAVEADGAYETTYADGTVERTCELEGGLSFSGLEFSYDPLLEGGDLKFPNYTLAYVGRKANYFDAAGNAQGAKLEVWQTVPGSGGRSGYRIFEGWTELLPELDDGRTTVRFTHESVASNSAPPEFVLSTEAQRTRDETDPSHDRMSDYVDTEFGRGPR